MTTRTIDYDNPNYSSDNDGVLYDDDKAEIIENAIGNTRMEYTIPDSVTSISNYAFYQCTSLTSITIPVKM